jgi:uncharacterized protein
MFRTEEEDNNVEEKNLGTIDGELEIKHQRLIEWFEDKGERVLIALSGGVDSAVVALVAKNALGNKNVLAITANYQTLSSEELKTAEMVAKELGINHKIIKYNELENKDFVKNDGLRCFHCRNELADNLIAIANQENFKLIVDGNNTDDLKDYRPGMLALRQKGIKSPLIETGFNKNDIRNLAKANRLSVYDKPSNACLASRVTKNMHITHAKLERIENCESIVKKVFDVKQVRVRDHGELARIEVERDEIAKLFDIGKLNQIEAPFKGHGFRYITIDIEGYKKSGLSTPSYDADIKFKNITSFNAAKNKSKSNSQPCQ